MKQREIIIFHETLWQSIVTDIFTIGSLIAAVLVGKWVGSEALQWVAGLLMMIGIIGWKPKYRWTFTSIEEAKDFLDSLKKTSARDFNNDALNHTHQDNI